MSRGQAAPDDIEVVFDALNTLARGYLRRGVMIPVDDQDDFVQITILKLIDYTHDPDDPSSGFFRSNTGEEAAAFLKTCLTNAFLDSTRRASRESTREVDPDSNRVAKPVAFSHFGPEAALLEREKLAAFDRLVDECELRAELEEMRVRSDARDDPAALAEVDARLIEQTMRRFAESYPAKAAGDSEKKARLRFEKRHSRVREALLKAIDTGAYPADERADFAGIVEGLRLKQQPKKRAGQTADADTSGGHESDG